MLEIRMHSLYIVRDIIVWDGPDGTDMMVWLVEGASEERKGENM